MNEGPQSEKGNYWLVLCAPIGNELLGPFTEEALVDRLRDLNGNRVQAFPYQGQPLNISTGPLRYLLTSDGREIPLFADGGPLEVDPGGFLYDPSQAKGSEDSELEDPEDPFNLPINGTIS
jgi:hypothetical protein